MKKYLIVSILTLGMLTAQAQENELANYEIKVGDTLKLNEPKSGNYKYVKFPRLNFIKKQGGIGSPSDLDGEYVVVTKVKTTKKDITKIKVKRANGRKFFNAYPSMTVHFEDALGAGEVNIK